MSLHHHVVCIFTHLIAHIDPQVAELPKHLIPPLMAACHAILSSDSEDNGMVAQRVLFDIHKTYKHALEEQSNPFFSWLLEVSSIVCTCFWLYQLCTVLSCIAMQLYSNLPQEFSLRFSSHGALPLNSIPGTRSFKLASEVALMIVFLFQCHPRRLQEHAPVLLPLMVKVRLMQATVSLSYITTTQCYAMQVASIAGPDLGDVHENQMTMYNDFRMAQIKSLAFLTVIARSQNLQPLLSPHKDPICGSIVRVMQTVPNVLTTRKELLIALRNILPTPFR
jgi:transformation/transcription domain-associated protein